MALKRNNLEQATQLQVGRANNVAWCCRELVRDPSIVRGKSVLEIGAGTGLCGIVAARLGASEVHTILLPPALQLILAPDS